MLRPIGTEYQRTYWSTPAEDAPHKVIVTYRIVAHEMRDGELAELSTIVRTLRVYTPNRHDTIVPRERKG